MGTCPRSAWQTRSRWHTAEVRRHARTQTGFRRVIQLGRKASTVDHRGPTHRYAMDGKRGRTAIWGHAGHVKLTLLSRCIQGLLEKQLHRQRFTGTLRKSVLSYGEEMWCHRHRLSLLARITIKELSGFSS